MARKPKILGAGLSFRNSLSSLNRSRITRLVQHHMAHQSWGIQDVHNYHRNGNGWAGIGYNWWIDFKGNIYEGRGWNQGAHASGYNATSLGIGYQGDFTKQTMPDAQLKSGIELNNWLMAQLELSTSAIVGHNQVGNTACPGKNFRMSELKNGAVSGSSSGSSSSTGIQWVGTNDKGKRIEAIVPSVNYYDTQRWTNPTGSFKKGEGWIVDNLYRVNGSLQYRVQNSNGDLYYITARPDLVRIVGSGSSSSSSSRPAPRSGEGIVDYMNRVGMDSSYSNRSRLASQYGISNYRGTAAQNTDLLNKISGSSGSGKSISQMADEVIRGNHGQGHSARQRSLGVDNATYQKVRAEVNRRL